MQTKKKAAQLQLDKAGLLAYLQESRGQSFTCSQIAGTHKVSSASVRVMLDKLVLSGAIRAVADGRKRVYWVPTLADLAAQNRAASRAANPFKPLVGYESYLHSRMNMRAV